MKIPIDREAFSEFVEQSGIFGTAQKSMGQCLKNWYIDGWEPFTDDMRADLETVMRTYRFHNAMVSFNKDFHFDPPLDTITCTITINDDEDDHCMFYRAIFDCDLNIIDDVISP